MPFQIFVKEVLLHFNVKQIPTQMDSGTCKKSGIHMKELRFGNEKLKLNEKTYSWKCIDIKQPRKKYYCKIHWNAITFAVNDKVIAVIFSIPE